ncbi:hypothetical protein F441_14737 [Phytophthora nicotianae CJ01A1]|uniref:RxLR effector protein n=1 Tax=Phytophthora nicotianae CJ01A1 TaxID=1317063 RepID=W2WGA7_PHYNI|nr:hypothetical protein F441_14737 [Phytophthora nicotianae CJ01A1]
MNIEEKDFSHIISPKLEIVKGYIMPLKATNPEDTTDLLSVVSNGFKGDGALAQAIVKKLAMLHSRNPVAAVASTAAEFEMLLFRRWFKSKIDPVSFYRQVFGVEEANAGRWQKAVVRRYTGYYNDKNAATRVSHTVNIIPRRS